MLLVNMMNTSHPSFVLGNNAIYDYVRNLKKGAKLKGMCSEEYMF